MDTLRSIAEGMGYEAEEARHSAQDTPQDVAREYRLVADVLDKYTRRLLALCDEAEKTDLVQKLLALKNTEEQLDAASKHAKIYGSAWGWNEAIDTCVEELATWLAAKGIVNTKDVGITPLQVEELVQNLCAAIGWKGLSKAERISAQRQRVCDEILPLVIQFYTRSVLGASRH